MDPLHLLKTKINIKKRFGILQNVSIFIVAIFAVIFASFVSDPSINKLGIYYLSSIVALVCIICHFLILKWQKNQSFIYFKGIVDISIIAALVHFTGIFGHYFFFLYFLPLLVSSLYLPILETGILAGLACLFTLLENIYSPNQNILSNSQVILSAFQVGGIILMAAFAQFISYEITREQKEIEEAINWATKVFASRSHLDNLLYSLGKIPISPKQKKVKKESFALKIGKIVETLSWILAFVFLLLYFLNFFSINSIIPFILIMIISFFYAAYHRLIFKKIVETNPKLAIQIDSFIVLVLLFLFAELLGGIASPSALIFVFGIIIGSLIFKPYFSFVILGLESLVIFSFIYLQPAQKEFILSNPYLALTEGTLLIVVSICSYFFSIYYFKKLAQREKENNLINQLVANKTQADAVFQSMGDGMFVVDVQKKIVLANRIVKKMIGWKKGKILDKFYGDIFKLKYGDKLISYETDCPIQKAISENRAVMIDNLTLITYENKGIPISFYAVPLKDENANVIGGLVILKDITREKEMDELKNEFLSITSHELNAPISAIEGYLSMVVDEGIGKVDKKAFEFIDKAYLGSQRLANLIKDLHKVSKIYRGRLRISTEPISIEKVIQQVINDFTVSMKKTNIILEYKSSNKGKTLPKVLSDPGLIREVITNLVGNAIKFTKKGSIIVTAYPQKNKMIVSVFDTGVGISKEDFPYIFERFYRAKKKIDGKEVPGTGLGLYIVKSILKLHGGKIWVESQLEKGSKFSFSLPLAPQIKKQK